jgi:hypothetical protein
MTQPFDAKQEESRKVFFMKLKSFLCDFATLRRRFSVVTDNWRLAAGGLDEVLC